MAEDGADEAEGDCAHHDEGLQVGAKRDGQKGVDHKQRDTEAALEAPQDLLLFPLFALEGVPYGRVVGQDHREDVCREVIEDLVRARHILVDIGGDVDNPLAVGAACRGIATAKLDPGRDGEGDLPSVRGPDAHGLQVPHGSPFLRGIAHHHPDIVPSSLNPLGLLTVEGLANLTGDIELGQTDGLAFVGDLEFDLLLAGTKGVRDLGDARVLGQPGFELPGDNPQFLIVGPRQLHVHGFPRREQR